MSNKNEKLKPGNAYFDSEMNEGLIVADSKDRDGNYLLRSPKNPDERQKVEDAELQVKMRRALNIVYKVMSERYNEDNYSIDTWATTRATLAAAILAKMK